MRKRKRENPCGVCGHYHKYEEGDICGICGHRMPDVSEKGSTIQVSAFPSKICGVCGHYHKYEEGEVCGICGHRMPECGVCGHYHKYEEGEVCGIRGHRMPDVSEKGSTIQVSAFPSKILPEFLFLGSYDNASRAELLKTLGISRILNIVPACQNLYKNSFTYHCLQDDQNLAFDDAIQFLEQCEKDRARVLVHCMLGKNRSAAVVIAYLMKSRAWNLAQSLQWVKERRPSVDLTQEVYQQLQEYEQKIIGSLQNQPSPIMAAFSSPMTSFNFGFPEAIDPIPAPVFNISSAPSLFSRPAFEVPPQGFTFGAAHNQHTASESPLNANQNPNGSDIGMDSS